MKPICATVDQASEVLTAGCVSITSPPNSAVNPPIDHQHRQHRGRQQHDIGKADQQEAAAR